MSVSETANNPSHARGLGNSDNASVNPSSEVNTQNNNPTVTPTSEDNTQKNLVRLYEIRTLPNVGFKTHMLNRYASLVECAPILYEIEGRASRILKLAFDPSEPTARLDFEDAEKIEVKVGTRKIVYKAMTDGKRMDPRGNFIPRKCQNVIINLIPEEIADCREVLMEFVAEFADFDPEKFEVVKVFNVDRPKFFENKIVIPVDNVKKIPLKYNKISAVEFDFTVARFVKAKNSSLVSVEVAATGYAMDKDIPRQERFRKACNICNSMEHMRIACPNKPRPACFICGDHGHMQHECRFFKPRKPRVFACTRCGSVGGKCTPDVCANSERIRNGDL